MENDFELLLTKKAWEDPDFASLLTTNPVKALSQLGVTVPDGIKLNIILQKPNTLYFTIPPANHNLDLQKPFELNQIDIWSSGKMFVWLASTKQKAKLLQLRDSIHKKEE